MFRRILLGCLLASASATTAMANGYYFHNSYFNYSAPQHNAYRGAGYGHGYGGGYGAPVVYYRVPIYVIPARRARVAAPCGCEATSSVTTPSVTTAAPSAAPTAKPPEPAAAAAPTPEPVATEAKPE